MLKNVTVPKEMGVTSIEVVRFRDEASTVTFGFDDHSGRDVTDGVVHTQGGGRKDPYTIHNPASFSKRDKPFEVWVDGVAHWGNKTIDMAVGTVTNYPNYAIVAFMTNPGEPANTEVTIRFA
jgi:hypothetical protein